MAMLLSSLIDATCFMANKTLQPGRRTLPWKFLVAALIPLFHPPLPAADSGLIFPQGKIFPFMGYSGVPARDARSGFSVAGPSYAADQEPELERAEAAGLSFPYKIGLRMNFHAKSPEQPLPLTAEEIRKQITAQVAKVADRKSICWWYLGPEEIRYWYRNEMEYLRVASEAIRAADPLKRPIWMYEPNFRTAVSLMKTGRHLDIIGKGVYVNLADYRDSRIWVRWSVEQEVQAIEQLAKTDTRQRIPIMLPELCRDPADPAQDHLIPSWVRHDVYLGLMSGAKGVAIWSLFRRKEVRRTWQIWYDAYAAVGQELTGPAQLGQVFLFGTKSQQFPVRIVAGTKEVELKKGASKKLETTTTSANEKAEKRIMYPSLSVSEYEHDGVTYLFLCNSSGTDRVTYQAEIPNDEFHVIDLMARRGYSHKDDRLYGWIEPLEVRCYRIESSVRTR